MTNPTIRRIAILLISFFCFMQSGWAQKGSLPGSGLKYFYEGLSAKKIDVRVDGKELNSDQVQRGKYVDIILYNVSGLTPVNNKYFLGADVLYSSNKKLLKNVKNIFSDFEQKGFDKKDLNDVKISINLRPEIIGQNDEVEIMVRVYDLHSKKYIRLNLNIRVVDASVVEKPQAPKPAAASSTGSSRMEVAKEKPKSLKGITLHMMEVSVDHSIQVAHKMAYLSIEMLGIKGSSMAEIVKGDALFSVTDAKGNPVKITDKLLHKVKGSTGGSIVDFTVKIPFKEKTLQGKKYTVHFSWVSPDKSKSIEVITSR